MFKLAPNSVPGDTHVSNQPKEMVHMRPFMLEKGMGFSKLQQHMKEVQSIVLVTSRSGFSQSIFKGTYKLDHYDENLEDFLESLGLSSIELGSVIRSAKIKISIRAPYSGSSEKRWSVTHQETADGTDFTQTMSFEIGKTFTTQENGVDEIILCTQTQENTVLYQSQVPSKGWHIENLVMFSPEGFTAFLKNVNKNVITINHYNRVNSDPL